jgi:uncharacterized membrane protein
MPDTIAEPPAAPSALSDATLFHRARMLVGAAVGACVFYGWFTHAGRGSCTGNEYTSSGTAGFTETCTSLTLQPSAIVYLVVALIVMRAMTIVLQQSATTDDALRTLTRARRLVIAIPIGSLVLAHAWFAALPFEPETPSTVGNLVLPGLIASVEIVTTPQP